jgi:hypothetical protein
MKNFFGDSIERFMSTHPVLSQFGKDKFGVSTPASPDYNANCQDMVSLIIQYIFIVIAVYLAMKCKNNGNISFVQIILAILFAPFYIFYRIIKPCI